MAGWLLFSPGVPWSAVVSGVIRRPGYLGVLLDTLGWSLAIRAGAGVLLTALLIAPLPARIGARENLLRAQFKGEYEAYFAHT